MARYGPESSLKQSAACYATSYRFLPANGCKPCLAIRMPRYANTPPTSWGFWAKHRRIRRCERLPCGPTIDSAQIDRTRHVAVATVRIAGLMAYQPCVLAAGDLQIADRAAHALLEHRQFQGFGP